MHLSLLCQRCNYAAMLDATTTVRRPQDIALRKMFSVRSALRDQPCPGWQWTVARNDAESSLRAEYPAARSLARPEGILISLTGKRNAPAINLQPILRVRASARARARDHCCFSGRGIFIDNDCHGSRLRRKTARASELLPPRAIKAQRRLRRLRTYISFLFFPFHAFSARVSRSLRHPRRTPG